MDLREWGRDIGRGMSQAWLLYRWGDYQRDSADKHTVHVLIEAQLCTSARSWMRIY